MFESVRNELVRDDPELDIGDVLFEADLDASGERIDDIVKKWLKVATDRDPAKVIGLIEVVVQGLHRLQTPASLFLSLQCRTAVDRGDVVLNPMVEFFQEGFVLCKLSFRLYPRRVCAQRRRGRR